MIYHSYGVDRIFPYHILIDTDSTSILFHIIYEAENSLLDNKFRDIIFEVIVQNNVISKFDTSHEYWQKPNVKIKVLEKKLGYFEIESIDNLCQVVVTVDPKDNYEQFHGFSCNKKQKGQKKELQV